VARRLILIPAIALVLSAGCSAEPPPPDQAGTSPSPVATTSKLSDLWAQELRAVDAAPCAGETHSNTVALSLPCERVLREVVRLAPLVRTDAERHGIPALSRLATETEAAANSWLDGAVCTQQLAPDDTQKLDCLTSLWTAMNGPHKMLETMKQAGL
jgi:hypothetical protein